MATKKFIRDLIDSVIEISNSRKEEIQPLIEAIGSSISSNRTATVEFVCTHNSRRSQTAEFFLDVFAREYGLNITALSSGTESTAFNFRMVNAIQSYGFELIKYGDDRNPLYIYKLGKDELYYYSKRYDEELIVYKNKIIVTVCGDAEENCPIIPGTYKRLHLGYVDPKHSDSSNKEEEVYKAKVQEIALEMHYITQQLVTTS